MIVLYTLTIVILMRNRYDCIVLYCTIQMYRIVLYNTNVNIHYTHEESVRDGAGGGGA